MRKKRYISFIAVAIFLGLVSSLWVFFEFTQAQFNAQQGRIDAFTYFIPYPTDILDDQFDAAHTDNIIGAPIETIISIAVHRGEVGVADSIIYYDHWEDNLESDITTPVQTTTQVWGDGNLMNGIAPTVRSNPDDTFQAGDAILLRNVIPSAARGPNEIFFDGGDTLTSIGGAIAVTLATWPNSPNAGILFAGAWELYPTNRWGTDYIIPVGEDLTRSFPGDNSSVNNSFGVVGLNVQAVNDNTLVNLDINADGTFDRTEILNEGKHLTQVSGINTGARVQADSPVQVHVFTGDPGEPSQFYEARAYTIVPDADWTHDYLAPRSSDGDFWLHNPNDTGIDIAVQTVSTNTVISIPAKSTIKYPPTSLSSATGIRFTALDKRPFYGIATLDADDAQDWGYALLPVELLAAQAFIGLGPGNNNNPPGPDASGGTGFESRVYVTTVTSTTILADYDNDGNPDDSFFISPLEEVSIVDPNDFDMTGAYLYTADRTPFLAVWGQDQSAPPTLPSIDVGTSIVPLPSLLLQKSFRLIEDADCTGTITLDDTIRFKLQFFNNTIDRISNVIIEDNLPVAVEYLPNSTTLNGGQIPDSSTGSTPFILDEGGYDVGNIDPFETGSLTFDVLIIDDSQTIINRADARSKDLPLGSDFVIVFTPTQVPVPILQIKNTLITPTDPITIGEKISFGLTITNSSSITITTLPLQYTFNEDDLTFLEATPPPDITGSGAISWTDLTTTFGDLLPGTTVGVTVSFILDQFPVSNSTVVTATLLGAERSNGLPPLICSDPTSISLLPPPPPAPPTATSTPPPSGGNGGGVTPPPPPPPTSTPAAAAFVPPVSTPVELPVAILPETGTGEVDQSGGTRWMARLVLVSVPVIILIAAILYAWHRHKNRTSYQE